MEYTWKKNQLCRCLSGLKDAHYALWSSEKDSVKHNSVCNAVFYAHSKNLENVFSCTVTDTSVKSDCLQITSYSVKGEIRPNILMVENKLSFIMLEPWSGLLIFQH